jgi:hypothetical protein
MTEKGADKAALMGRNEYARHRGCAPNAVSKAINSGRIRAAVTFDGDGNFVGIDAVRADALWAGNTDPVEAARNGKFYDAPAAAGAKDPAAVESTVDGQGAVAVAVAAQQPTGNTGDLDLQPPAASSTPSSKAGDNDSYLKARAEREQYAAKSAQLDYLKTIGKLVEAAAVRREVGEALAQLKTSLLRIPERTAQLLAAESDPARITRILGDELRIVLDECSRQFADDTADRVDEPAEVSP